MLHFTLPEQILIPIFSFICFSKSHPILFFFLFIFIFFFFLFLFPFPLPSFFSFLFFSVLFVSFLYLFPCFLLIFLFPISLQSVDLNNCPSEGLQDLVLPIKSITTQSRNILAARADQFKIIYFTDQAEFCFASHSSKRSIYTKIINKLIIFFILSISGMREYFSLQDFMSLTNVMPGMRNLQLTTDEDNSLTSGLLAGFKDGTIIYIAVNNKAQQQMQAARFAENCKTRVLDGAQV